MHLFISSFLDLFTFSSKVLARSNCWRCSRSHKVRSWSRSWGYQHPIVGQCWICQCEAFNSRCSDPYRRIIIWKIVFWAGKLLEKLNSNKWLGVRGAFQSHFGGKPKSQWRKMWERICLICRTPHLGNWLQLGQQDAPAAMPLNDLWDILSRYFPRRLEQSFQR